MISEEKNRYAELEGRYREVNGGYSSRPRNGGGYSDRSNKNEYYSERVVRTAPVAANTVPCTYVDDVCCHHGCEITSCCACCCPVAGNTVVVKETTNTQKVNRLKTDTKSSTKSINDKIDEINREKYALLQDKK
jgi:hypothetical protein